MFNVAPDVINIPYGCRFHPKCPQAGDICKMKEPPLIDSDGGKVRCWKYSGEWKGAW